MKKNKRKSNASFNWLEEEQGRGEGGRGETGGGGGERRVKELLFLGEFVVLNQ